MRKILDGRSVIRTKRNIVEERVTGVKRMIRNHQAT